MDIGTEMTQMTEFVVKNIKSYDNCISRVQEARSKTEHVKQRHRI